MTIDASALTAKIKEFYPELARYGVDVSAVLDKEKDAWIVTVAKGQDTLETHIEVQEAENCVNGVECVHLGTQIGQFVKNYCEGTEACSV